MNMTVHPDWKTKTATVLSFNDWRDFYEEEFAALYGKDIWDNTHLDEIVDVYVKNYLYWLTSGVR